MDRDKQDLCEAGRYRNSTFDAKHGIDENKAWNGFGVKMGETRKYAQHKRWTKEEEEMLIRYSEKMTEGGLAKKLKRPTTSVRSKRSRMGVQLPSA